MRSFNRTARFTILAVSLLAVTTAVSACGGNSNTDAPPSSAANAGNTPPSANDADKPANDASNGSGGANARQTDAAATRTVNTTKGEIEIPADPQRIVAGYYSGTLLALGIQPVGGSKEWWMGSPFLTKQEASIADIGSPASAEKVLALKPDLIVINDTLSEEYDDLAKIAPTMFIAYESIKNIHDEVKQFGALMNRTKEAEAWEAEYDSKAEQAREKLKGKVKPGMTAVLLEADGKTLAVMGDNYGRGGEVIYNALRFKAPDWVQKNVIDNGVQYQEISMEKLGEIANADYIFLSTYEGTTEAQLKAVTDSSIWKSLPAVKQGHLIPLDYKTYFYFDPVSVLGQIDALTQTLLESK
ncbi:ABC transporter substrate-binding protein [Paenibacillus glycinis]|uniref:ABC transporter substrate-binding protein n=1 Tax=Paenibacillus glycinis TaxID=2697035 RepID=A0ABW9XPZ5_9BACL|nr:ABC transporter substrate-binding protein [Paenibacillus glycinis]NBD24695.1 ABC transporter substrate-binding protein [Paenibacillus glycinis]